MSKRERERDAHVRLAQAHFALVTRWETGKNANGKSNLSSGRVNDCGACRVLLYITRISCNRVSLLSTDAGGAQCTQGSLVETPAHIQLQLPLRDDVARRQLSTCASTALAFLCLLLFNLLVTLGLRAVNVLRLEIKSWHEYLLRRHT